MPIPPSTGGLFEAVVGQREEMRHGQNEGRSVLRTTGIDIDFWLPGLLGSFWQNMNINVIYNSYGTMEP